MAAAPPLHARDPFPTVALSFSWRGTQRSCKLSRASGLIATALGSLLALWYFGATAYFVFHDQLVASLISHQADTQYAYEDRIAVLETELDRQTSRSLLDRQALATTIQSLTSRSASLEAHAATIDGLVRSILTDPTVLEAQAPGKAGSGSDLLAPQLPTAGSSALPTPASASSDASHEDHAELSPVQLGGQLSLVLDRVERHQLAGITQLRTPVLNKLERLQTALLETGLSSSRWRSHAKNDVGGPFVPLPEGSHPLSFEENLALLKAAVTEHARLTRMIDTVPLRRPIEGRLEVTSPFGARIDPFLGQAAMHTGVDLVEAYGAPVRATANGIVTAAGPEGGYGNMVEVDHGDGVVTRYAHLSSVDVAVHQKVSSGSVVGRAGSTGRATGPHLHYETRINGVPVDPTRFLRAGSGLFRS